MTHDLIVIGAGPAGMAAACTASELGLRVALLDEQPAAGGQIYRNVAAAPEAVTTRLGPDYRAGRALVERLNASEVDTHLGAFVWNVTTDLEVTAMQAGRALRLKAPQLIAATGALERPTPVPGWTLPGVMNAGAAQIALKAGGLVPSGPVALAGSGPLLLLVACQLIDAGARVVGVVETGPASNRWNALPHLPAALRTADTLRKGAHLLLKLRHAGVTWHRQASGLEVLGSGQCTGLRFHSGGRQHELGAAMVLLHHGVVPNTQLTRLLGAAHDWDDAQLAWRVRCDAEGQSTVPGLRVAGDGAGIAGALAAAHGGALAALGGAHALGRIGAGELRQRAAPHRRELRRQLAIRPLLDALYRPPRTVTEPEGGTIVCRCEEVSAQTVREMAGLGCLGPNQAKFFSRCGMGPCQGRICGTVVTQLIAACTGRGADEVGAFRVRPPLKPVPLGAIAALHETAPSTLSQPTDASPQ